MGCAFLRVAINGATAAVYLAVAGSWLIAYHPRNRSTDLGARSRFTGEILVTASLAIILAASVWLIVVRMKAPRASGP